MSLDLLRRENQELRFQYDQLLHDQERAKKSVAEHIFYNNIEKEDLQNKIKFLKAQIAQLTTEVNARQPRTSSIPPSPSLSKSNPAITLLPVSPDEKDIQYDEAGELKAGTLPKLVECLYMENKLQPPEYGNVFLLTYRSYATTGVVLEELIAGYTRLIADATNSEPSLKGRLRIGNFIKRWVTDNYYDFAEDPELVERVSYFIGLIEKHDEKLGQSIRGRFVEKQKGTSRFGKRTTSQNYIFGVPAPNPILPKGTITNPQQINNPFSFILDCHHLELARQLTLMDYELCKAIEPKECLGMAWTKEDKEKRSPNLLKMIKRFNLVSKWVAATLVQETNLKKRAKLLSHLISVIQHLRELNNFNAIFQIIGGLGNSSVHRLAKTFALLKPDKKKILEEMKVLTNPNKSWVNYRTNIHEINPPCVPFIGVYQTDLTFIDDGNPTKFSNGFINFKKCRLVAGVIIEIQQYQQKPYNLTVVPAIAESITKALAEAEKMDDKALYNQSLIAEPRQ